MEYDITLIQQTIFFSGLSSFEIKQIFEGCASVTNVAQGDKIIEKGTVDDNIYFLPKGKVQVELETSNLYNHQLTEIKGPAVFGEMSFLDKSQRSATVKALGNFEIYIINGRYLDELLMEMPNTGYKISRNIACSLSKIVRRSTEMISREIERNQLLHDKAAQLAVHKYKATLSNIVHYINQSA